MSQKQLLVDVDEFTLILMIDESELEDTWNDEAHRIITEFEDLSAIPLLFGECHDSYNKIAGYNTAYEYGENPFYFSISFHANHPRMGIAIKFSATSWKYYKAWYRASYEEDTDVYLFLKMVQSNSYETRLSRIDLTVDFINYALNTDDIYKQLASEKIIIKNAKDKKNSSQINAIVTNNVVSTIYIGSRGRNINSMMRIYDKRLEQLSNYGIYLKTALDSESWVRFEMVIKGKYSHDFTKAILEIEDTVSFKTLILSAITDRYQFRNSETSELTSFSNEMISVMSAKSFEFNTPSPRNNTLLKSITHITTNSGLFPTLYKIEDIWGKDGLKDFYVFLAKSYESYLPNDDVSIWLKKNKEDYLTQGKPFPQPNEKVP